jgi:hypothetical protein
MLRWMGLVVFVIAAVAAFFAWKSILHQDDAARNFVAAPAVIQETHVLTHRSRKSTTYSPEARYTYTYQGQPHTATQVLAASANGSQAWANSVLRRIDRAGAGIERPGAWASTAYVNPEHPEEAVLVRDYLPEPYFLGMLTLPACALGLCLLGGFIGGGRKRMEAVALDDSGWRLLLPYVEIGKALRSAWVCFAGFGLAVLPVPLHWTLRADQGGVPGAIFWGLAAGTIVGLGVVLYRRRSVSRHVSDARLHISPAPVRRGHPLSLAVDIDARVPLHVTRITARLLCTEHYREKRGSKTYTGTRKYHEQAVELGGGELVGTGKNVDGNGETMLNPDLPGSSDTLVKTYPYYTWEIQLKLELYNMVDYGATYPLEVA